MIRTRWAIATLLAGCLLAGCSEDDPEPEIDAESTPSENTSSATVTASPTVSPTVTPTAVLGPEKTVRAWVQARNVALQDGDTTEVDEWSAANCSTCDESIDPIRTVYANGGHYETSGWTVVAAKVDSQTDEKATVNTGIEYAAGQTVPETGADPVTYQAEKHIVVFKLARTGTSWKVTFIGYLS